MIKMKNSDQASIVNISSILGVKVDTECSAYCCSAAAIIKLSECAAKSDFINSENIKVNGGSILK